MDTAKGNNRPESKDILQSPQSTQRTLPLCRAILMKMVIGSAKRQLKQKYGKDIYVRSSISVVKDENDVVTGFMGVSFDIGPQKQLKDQITHLADIADQTSETIISKGPRSTDHQLEQRAERLFGYGREKPLVKRSETWA